jgi:hypothetical protein
MPEKVAQSLANLQAARRHTSAPYGEVSAVLTTCPADRERQGVAVFLASTRQPPVQLLQADAVRRWR